MVIFIVLFLCWIDLVVVIDFVDSLVPDISSPVATLWISSKPRVLACGIVDIYYVLVLAQDLYRGGIETYCV